MAGVNIMQMFFIEETRTTEILERCKMAVVSIVVQAAYMYNPRTVVGLVMRHRHRVLV